MHATAWGDGFREGLAAVTVPCMRALPACGWGSLMAATGSSSAAAAAAALAGADQQPRCHNGQTAGSCSTGGAAAGSGSGSGAYAAEQDLVRLLGGGEVDAAAALLAAGLDAGRGGLKLMRLSALQGYDELLSLFRAVREVGAGACTRRLRLDALMSV